MKDRNLGSRLLPLLKIGSACSILALASAAYAQEAPAEAMDDAASASEIVVTGTLIRGIAPPGTNSIGVSKEAVQETGATSVSQLLQTIPQFGSFNTLQQPVGGGNFQTTNRPNLRDLPGFTTTGGAATLMLVNGHRVVGMGLSSTTPDADIVPPGVIERVEIIPDGGSALYGSDAVAGVVNFITLKKFNGLSADARYGFGDEYHTFDANVTAGKDWGSGSIFVSYNYAEHSAIYGRDRDYVRQYEQPLAGSPGLLAQSLSCPVGNVRVGNSYYGLPFTPSAGAKLNQINNCDNSDSVTTYPEEQRHTVFAGLNQQLSDALKFDVTVFYMHRRQYISLGYGGFAGSANLSNQPGSSFSPFFNGNRVGLETTQTVYYVLPGDEASNQTINLSTWGVAPEFAYDLGGSWQARLSASYSESTAVQHTSRAFGEAITNSIRFGLFNPYNPGASDARGLAAIRNYETYGKARQRQFNTRLVIDGELFALPGGGVKVAVGAEYSSEGFVSQKGDQLPGTENTGSAQLIIDGNVIANARARLPVANLSRNVKSVFGELVVPIFGTENATPGFQELTLSASGRYDNYSDFGSTFNPKFGLTWKPTDWVKVRGSWGKSFAAPSLADSASTDPGRGSYTDVNGAFIANFIVPPAVLAANGLPKPDPLSTNQFLFLLQGSRDLEPQTATTWSAGLDIDPPFIPGLRLSATYFDIMYRNLIGIAPFSTPSIFFPTYQTSYVVQPTAAQLQAYKDQVQIQGTVCSPEPSCVFIIEDSRKQNLGRFHTAGLDFAANYQRKTGFGSVDFSLAGSYLLKRESSATLVSPFVNEIEYSRFRLRGSIGAWFGNLRAQATWNHTGGYPLIAPVAAVGPYPVQTRIGAFDVFDLYFKYNVPGEGAMKDVSFTLNVNNLFDRDPPLSRRGAGGGVLLRSGYENGATVGRLVQLGVSKKF